MKFNILLILIVMLISLPLTALAGCPTGTGGYDPLADVGMTGGDPSFSTALHSKGVFINTDSQDASQSVISNAKVAPDERPVAYPNPNTVNMSMPDPNPKPVSTSNSSSSQNNQPVEAKTVSVPIVRPMDFSGKWSIKLNDSQRSSIDLILIQTGSKSGSVMGSGSLFEGSSKIPLTASGTVSDKEAKLSVRTQVNKFINQIDRQYNIDLFLIDDVLSGSYEMSSGDEQLIKGNATATKSGA